VNDDCRTLLDTARHTGHDVNQPSKTSSSGQPPPARARPAAAMRESAPDEPRTARDHVDTRSTAGRHQDAEPHQDADPHPARALFGSRLRYWRTLRGLGQRDLGERLGYDRSAVSRIEAGHRWPSRRLAAVADRVLASHGEMLGLWSLVDQERHALPPSPARLPDKGTESAASGERITVVLPPAMPTTPALAAATELTAVAGGLPVELAPTPTNATLVTAGIRTTRPHHATPATRETPESLDLFIEACSTADDMVGGRHLLEPVEQRYALTRAQLDDTASSTNRVRELSAAVARLAALDAWLWYDSDRHDMSWTRYLEALRLASQAGDTAHRVLLLCRLATLALRGGRLADADVFLTAAHASRTGGGDTGRAADNRLETAWLARTTAIRHAAAGDAAGCDRMLDRAGTLLTDATADVPEPAAGASRYLADWTPLDLGLDAAFCAQRIAEARHSTTLARRAARHLSDAVDHLGPSRRRDHALVLVRLASALEYAGEPDTASAHADTATHELAGAGSVRVQRELSEVRTRLLRHSATRDLRHGATPGVG
jgi:ribosome-binding protein aMBF1 (putative translation factor)